MSCQIEQIADCGDISCLGRSLYIQDKDDTNWLNQCSVSLTSCGSLLAVGFKNRLCLLTTQWISSTNSNTYLITWSGTLSSDITSLLAVPVSPTTQSSQNGSDWFCVIVGFKNGAVGFYTNTGHLLLLEKLDDKPVQKISCHTGVYGTLPDDIYLLFQNSECVISGSSLWQTLRYAKVQLARVQAGVQSDFSVDGKSIQIKKWTFTDQDIINDSVVVGLELKNTYDHLLTASAYGGYDTWYRSIPPHNTLVLGVGARPYVAFHYALEGGTAPPLQDVARVVANRIKSALPGWLGGGIIDNTPQSEMHTRAEPLSMRSGLCDVQRHGANVILSPDRRLAAIADNLGRVAILDVARGHLIRLFKGYRDAQCAFIQIFEQDNNKRLQLSTIKEIRRALLLVIYNPKKGLIDIRLMQRGNRVAVFTATKNGKLLYNTSGLLGAEQSYVQRKVNIPEYQCVLIDPDGKLKRFTIPFHFALEGEHSQRSKDLHILREMRHFIKKISKKDEDFVEELIKKVICLKTTDLKKQCLDMLIRNYEISPKIIMRCLEVFWDSLESNELEPIDLKCKTYFKNLALVTLFYRRINNESTDDMLKLIEKINVDNEHSDASTEQLKKTADDFELFENDIIILDRLLSLAQEKDYRDHHARVSFAYNIYKSYKDFITAFELEQVCINMYMKPSLSNDKLSALAADIFNTIFKLKDIENITSYLKESKIEVKDLVRLIIMHFMDKPLEEISLKLIKKFISVLYHLCRASKDATNIVYNEISPWWQSIRDLLVDMPCPLRSMIIAMACRVVTTQFEHRRSIGEEEAWESVTKENAKWSILIGKLEDISILSIILFFKETFKGKSLPKLQISTLEINLKFIYSRGKGSVSELISKWLCGMGVIPEAIIANEMILKDSLNIENTKEEEDTSEQLFLDENRLYVDQNPKIFKWLALLKKQFPFSTSADNIIANMCWEYATAWQNDRQDMEKLAAVITCLKTLRDIHLSFGLCTIVWMTHIRVIFEMSCRLVNKIGRLPKERLCFQDVGLSDMKLVKFLELSTQYLNYFLLCATKLNNSEKIQFQFEKIWDDSMPALVEVAQDTKNVNYDVLNLIYQISCALYYQCHFNIKVTKPLNTLFDIDLHYIFENITSDQNDVNRLINKASEHKLKAPRMKFLSKVIFAALELIICEESDTTQKQFQTFDYTQWMDKVHILADLWNIDSDFLGRQQVIGLYQLGYDSLALEMVREVRDASSLIAPLVGAAGARLKQRLGRAAEPSECLAALPPNLVTHLDTIKSDSTVPANVTLQSTASVLQQVMWAIEKSDTSNAHAQIIRLAELMVNGCEILEQLGA